MFKIQFLCTFRIFHHCTQIPSLASMHALLTRVFLGFGTSLLRVISSGVMVFWVPPSFTFFQRACGEDVPHVGQSLCVTISLTLRYRNNSCLLSVHYRFGCWMVLYSFFFLPFLDLRAISGAVSACGFLGWGYAWEAFACLGGRSCFLGRLVYG